jgi:hypothetical protein
MVSTSHRYLFYLHSLLPAWLTVASSSISLPPLYLGLRFVISFSVHGYAYFEFVVYLCWFRNIEQIRK